jgi:NAD(P)H dehydrogenase (quinone)
MIAVTGATGNLGGLVIDHLLDRGVAPSEIVAAVRSPEKASDLTDRGVEVRKADYDEPDTLDAAFEGIDQLLLISSSEVGRRVTQHRNVVDAAAENDVDYLVYTSMLRADSSPLLMAEEHKATEEAIRDSGIPFTLLRNGWYIENYTEQIGQALDQEAFVGSAEDGRISAATRSDYAEAAAVVLTEDGHEGEVYELGGDEAFTMEELAAEVAEQSGREIVYQDLPAEEYKQVLVDVGLPEGYAEVLADSDEGIADGHLYTESDDLRRLIGHPTTPLEEAVAEALADRD